MVPATREPSSIADSDVGILKPDENPEGLKIVEMLKMKKLFQFWWSL